MGQAREATEKKDVRKKEWVPSYGKVTFVLGGI